MCAGLTGLGRQCTNSGRSADAFLVSSGSRKMGTSMARTSTRALRQSIVPAVFIAWIWIGTLQVLGYQLPLLIGVPLSLLLFGLLLWGLPPEMYWPASTRSANPDGRVTTWWQSVRRHRFKSLSFVVMTAWVWTFFTLELKGVTDASYFIGLSLLATIVLIHLMWGGSRGG
jgi:hypothetical protein